MIYSENIKEFRLVLKKELPVVFISASYLIIAYLLVGLRVEHWLMVAIFNICYFVNAKTRRFILAFAIFMVFGIIYDLMKAFPNYNYHSVDIASVYHFEQKVFGILSQGQLLTPNEFFAQNHNSFLDILSGLFYINWMPVPLAFAFYLYLTNKQLFLQFSLTFLFVNLIGFCIYYIHPAAPPWYIQYYGFERQLNIPGNTAGLARFDQLIHIPVFHSIYSRNSNVFAALPSLHSAYPVVVLFYSLKDRLKWVSVLLAFFMMGIWFSAVYSGHHYVTDVISGIVCAIIGIFVFQRYLLHIKGFQKGLSKYLSAIS